MSSTSNIFDPNNDKLNENICFKNFDTNNKNRLDFEDFQKLCAQLFQNSARECYKLENSKTKEIFTIFDKNQDNFIDKKEFENCWKKWIEVILKPKAALLVIDVQNDFISGSLSLCNCPAKQNGADVVPAINALLENVKFDAVFYSLDWHPQNHISFVDNVKLRQIDESCKITAENAKPFDDIIFKEPRKIVQKVFPEHCVQNGWGAQLHSDLKFVENGIKILKGTNPDVDSYSAFFDNERVSKTELDDELKKLHITDVYVCGLCWDYCVGITALHALELGFRTLVIEDCIRGIDFETIEKAKNKIISSNGVILNSARVKDMLKGLDRLPEHGYKLAMDLKEKI